MERLARCLIGDVSKRQSDRDPRYLRAEFNTNLSKQPPRLKP